jgi:hypothetical protein
MNMQEACEIVYAGWKQQGGADVSSTRLLALPEDVRSFVQRVTMHLQANRSKKPEQHDAMFQEAYRLYCKYDVEGRANDKVSDGCRPRAHDGTQNV